MKIFFYTLVIFFLGIQSITSQENIQRILFGSCSHQDKPQKIWNAVIAQKPDLFIFLGDNIYGDTTNMSLLKSKYQRLANKAGIQKLKKTCPIIATWDDHDYGYNDAGASYSKKKESQKIFLDFFKEPINSIRRKTAGIYTSYYYGKKENRIQIILLDVRYFRSDLLRITNKKKQLERHKKSMGIYVPTKYKNATMLGKKQWKWLEKELTKRAKIRIIASSTQFLTHYNGWEAWRNMPNEYNKMLSLIKKTEANGVIFISGDTHWAELSMNKPKNLYPLYDLTSSGLTEVFRDLGPNQNRIYSYLGVNFGSIQINWKKDPIISFLIYDINGKKKISKKILLSELEVKK